MALWDSSYNLLRRPRPLLVRRPPLPRLREPKLAVPWGSFHQSLASSLAVLLRRPVAPGAFLGGPYFRDCWLERRIPKRAVLAAALWHVVFLVTPFPSFPAPHRNTLVTTNTILTWSGPVQDLPALELPGETIKPTPRGEPAKPLPAKGADALHPRQTIFSDPVHPNHPRQMLINASAPPEPPKILPAMPNIVHLGTTAQPARPRLEINREVLAKLRPKQTAMRWPEDVAVPDVPNLEKQLGNLNIAATPISVPKPRLALNASVAPRIGARKVEGDAGAAPEVTMAAPSASLPQTLIALSATPAPPAEVLPVASGNLAARISISPEGERPGVPGGSSTGMRAMNGDAGGGPASLGGSNVAGNRSGSGPLSISISGGNPNASSPVSGPGVNLGARPGAGNGGGRVLPDRPVARSPVLDASHSSTPHDIGALKPGAQPESVFGLRKMYTLHVNMPNLSSATGSWVLHFTELREDDPSPILQTAPAAELTGPVPLRKVDPKYPPALIQEKVEGEVVLYAVIRKDGSVDSIQLVHGVDDRLDANAMDALSRWKFKPAERAGEAVELEAVVRIPFRVAGSRF
jgi:TonB family protein